jgi:Ca2+-transporting ATPase
VELFEYAHAAPAGDVARALRSDPAQGLSEAEAAGRLAFYGENRTRRPERPSYAAIAARQLADPLVLLLVAAAAVSAVIGDGIEAVAIALIVALNAVLGFVQEARAEQAVIALRQAAGRRARVVRAGIERELPAEHVVPGDLLVLREGDRVEADARIVEEHGLAVDESILTGESVPAEKGVDPVGESSPLGDRTPMAYAGTWVVRGRGTAFVTATGERTEQGRIAVLTTATRPPPTPLQVRLGGLVRVAVGVGVVVTVAIAGGMAARGSSLEEAFLVGVSVAVAAVPEGLTAAVTIALALGARTMAARGAIVRRLVAVETLGETTVICTDKTGTLTENRLQVAACIPEPRVSTRELLSAAVLASAAPVGAAEQDGAPRVGDPVDAALLLAAEAQGLRPADLRGERRLVREIPFDPERRRMAALYEESGRLRLLVKGAPETVLERSQAASDDRQRLLELAGALASQGSRVLAVAERRLDGSGEAEPIERELVPLGLVAFHDPLRKGVPDSVRQARSAGIGVMIVTGDHQATAAWVGQTLGIPAESVRARVEPAEKLAIVEGLQATGEIVAVTGDGVNDAPALRRADVGVAMGRSGTEAAREASAVVLTDDDFSTIVAAVREGRRIADNIRTFLAFLLSANLGEVFLFAAAVFAGLPAPLTVVQVLTVNVLTDGLPAIALSREPAGPAVMRPRARARGVLLHRSSWVWLAAIGTAVGLAALGAFLVGRGRGDEVGQTMAFATIALAELALVFGIRAGRAPVWRASFSPVLAGSVAASAAVLAVTLFVPALRGPFGTVALTAAELGVVAVLALAPLAAFEIAKRVAPRFLRSSPQEGSAPFPMPPPAPGTSMGRSMADGHRIAGSESEEESA